MSAMHPGMMMRSLRQDRGVVEERLSRKTLTRVLTFAGPHKPQITIFVILTMIDAALVVEHGAVSEPVARAMAQGAIRHSAARVAAAVTGIAGPTGGVVGKPVGTVWFAWCLDGTTFSERCHFDGGRAAVRVASLYHTLKRLAHMLGA